MPRDGKPGLAPRPRACVAASTSLRFARNDISAVLLAGGESRRMGLDKATLLFHGKPLWQTQVELLRKLEPAEIFVSARTDPVWRPIDVQFVADAPPSRGPLSGIAASLAQMHTAHLFALAIDMPFMTDDFLRHLRDQIDIGCGVIAKIGDRYEPLTAIYPREARVDVRNALAGADFSLQSVVRGLIETGKLRELPLTQLEKDLFLNLNQRSDLAPL